MCLLKPYYNYNTNFFNLFQLFTPSCTLLAPKAQAVCLCDAPETVERQKSYSLALSPLLGRGRRIQTHSFLFPNVDS